MLNGSGVPARIHFRLWSSKPLPGGALLSNADNPSIFMIVDLVEAVGGSLCESTGLTAQFETPSHAVSAAKHIQKAVQEFSAASASQKIGTAILVTDAESRSDTGVRQTLEHAVPGQIFVTPAIRKVLPDNASWRFRALNGGSATGTVTTAEELLWTDQATYEQLAESLRSGQTWSVISEPVMAQEAPVAESTRFDPTQIPIATDSSDTGGLFDALEERSASKVPYLVAAGVILAAMVGGYAFLHYSESQQVPSQSNTSVVSNTAAKSPTTEPSTGKVQKVEAATAPPKTNEPSVAPVEKKPSAEVASLPPRKIEVPPPAAPSTPTTQRPTEDAGRAGVYHMTAAERAEAAKGAADISPKQINQILAMADEQTGDGKFSEARRKYLIVLYLEPGNSAANRGMLRLVKRQQQADR